MNCEFKYSKIDHTEQESESECTKLDSFQSCSYQEQKQQNAKKEGENYNEILNYHLKYYVGTQGSSMLDVYLAFSKKTPMDSFH